jgi:hypothetical protein
MGLFGNNNAIEKKVKKSVKMVKETDESTAISLDKIENISLRKKTEHAGISLKKAGMGGVRAQVMVVLDHSGSMSSTYRSGKVQELVERFLGFGMAVDIDGEIPVVPFDSGVYNAVTVNMSNYHDVVNKSIYKPYNMGSTNLTEALKAVREEAKKTDAPLFVAIVTDGEPNERNSAREIVKDLANYPVFLKFLALQKVSFLEELDNMGSDERLLDNVNTKEYYDLSSVTDEQFATDMVDEYKTWVDAALAVGILTQ